MNNLIPIFIASIAIATVLNVVLRRFNMPTVIGYILTGMVIGAVFNIQVHGNETLEHIAEFGVVFLMFTIGLEFSVEHLKSMKKEVFVIGFLQVFVTGTVLAMLANLIFDVEFKSAIVVGAGLALSSTAIVLKMLNESGLIKSKFGRNSLGILIFQDIAVIPILLMITIFTNDDKSLLVLLTDTVINAVIALAILIFIGKFVLRYLFKAVSNTNSKEIYMGSILLTVIGASYIAHYFGFSYSLGGFIAGMMIADTIYKYQVEADLIPFRDLLLGVFFVSIGLQIDLNIVMSNILPVILLCIAAMIIKTICIFTILFFISGKRAALKTAITLSQIGEFSLVVFSLLLASNMMDPISVQVLMVVIVLTMILTPFLINNIDRIVGLVIKVKIEEEALVQSSLIAGHIILCGYSAFGRIVSEQLDKSNINHVILTNNTEAEVKAKEAGKTVGFGEASDQALLNRLKIKTAMSTILALEDFDEVKQASAAITLIDPSIKVIAKVPTEEEREELVEFNHELLLDGNNQTALIVVDQINKSRMLAKETSKLEFLNAYSLDKPKLAIEKVEREQARLLDIMSKSFNALREDKNVMHVKAFHDSFKVLSEIIGAAISNIMNNASLLAAEYERINTLMDNQHQLILINNALEELGKELIILGKNEKTNALSHVAIEGLDTVLLSLIDIASDYNEMDMMILKKMTSESQGLAQIRESYLVGTEIELDASTKAILLSSTNHMDRLKSLFGMIGNNYKKLAETV